MNRYLLCAIAWILALMAAGPACADSGIISVKSAFAVDETVERLTAALEAKGMTVFLTVDHAKGAQ
ncbi:MAG: hypothetical protein PVH30_01490, partial [Desulfobacterales bacterium]